MELITIHKDAVIRFDSDGDAIITIPGKAIRIKQNALNTLINEKAVEQTKKLIHAVYEGNSGVIGISNQDVLD